MIISWGAAEYKPVLVEDDFIETIFWGWRVFEVSEWNSQ